MVLYSILISAYQDIFNRQKCILNKSRHFLQHLRNPKHLRLRLMFAEQVHFWWKPLTGFGLHFPKLRTPSVALCVVCCIQAVVQALRSRRAGTSNAQGRRKYSYFGQIFCFTKQLQKGYTDGWDTGGRAHKVCYGVVHVSISFTLAHFTVSEDPVHGLVAQVSKWYFTTLATLLAGLMVLWGSCVQGSNPVK